MEQYLKILFWAVVGVGALIVILRAVLQGREEVETYSAPMPQEAPPQESEFIPVEVDATVVDMNCGVSLVGLQTPKATKEFVVAFRTDFGELLKLEVPEEMYDGFEIGQRGLLTVVDGTLYSFVPNEEE